MEANKENLPEEYVPVVSMIQKQDSIKKGVLALKEKILVSAGDEFLSWEKEKQDKFLESTIITIAKDKELSDCFQSTEGKLSIIGAVEKAVSTGLEIGGKHAYLIPQGRNTKKKDGKGKDIWVTEIRFSIRDRGYYALLCGGKQPIFLDLRWGTVYEKDQCSVNKGNGEVIHNVCIAEDKGKFIGVWVQCRKMNSQLEVDFFSLLKINQWKKCSKTTYDDKPWDKWPEEMALQASIRHFCDKYETARELLAASIYDDESENEKDKSVIEDIETALSKQDPIEEEEKKEKPDEEKPDEKEKLDEPELF